MSSMTKLFFSMRLLCAATFLAAAISGTAHAESANEIPTLLKERRCYACHELTQQLIGPSYQAIANRHGPQAEVMTEVLAHKIINGGGGNWGLVPMVPNEHVTLDESRAMVKWILQLNKKTH